ncbi:unnamed protein product [Mucor circinelloides]
MVIHTKEKSFDSKFELPYGSTRYSLDSLTAIKSSSCAIEHSKKRYSDLPEKPRSSTTVQIEKIPEKRPKEHTALHLSLFHTVTAPSSSLKRRFRLFVDDNLGKKKRDHSRGTQAILESCIDHIHAYESAYKSCIESSNGLRKWTSRHTITVCYTTNTPHDTA